MNRESGSVITAISGDSVAIDQSAVRSIDAERVELRQAAAQNVRGETFDASDSAFLSVHAAEVQLDDCAAAGVFGEHVTMRDSTALLVIARRIDGDARNVMSPAAAFAFGAGLVVGLAALRRLRRIF
jgi:hypothetical protein